MLTPNGGVFGRNPKFNNVTVEGDLVSTGGMTVTPNANAPTSNVTIGPSAGAALNAAATNSIMLGSGAGDVVQASSNNIALGTDALGAFVSGALLITTTAAGSGGSAGTYTVPLTKDSGTGEMSVYPTISATVGAGGTVTSTSFTTSIEGGGGITVVGSSPTVQSGIIFRPADPVPAGFPSNFRCRLDSVQGDNVAIGQDALLLNSTGRDNIAIGVRSVDALTTGQGNICLGRDAGGGLTTGNGNVIVGTGAATASTNMGGCIVIGQQASPSLNASSTIVIGSRSGFSITSNAGGTTIVGVGTVQSSTLNVDGTVFGGTALRACTSITGTTAIGSSAGRYVGATGTTEHNGTCVNNVYIGLRSRSSAVGQTNEVVIGGVDACGDGSNTTVIGNTSTTSTRIPAGNLTLSNGNLILGTAGNGISFAATTDPTIPATKATGAITRTATNVSDGDTVTIDTTVYTFKTTLTPANWEVLIGADAAGSLTNLRNAILGTGGTPGTDYQVPNAHPTVTALTIFGTQLPLEAITAGTAGNSIALAETSAQLSVTEATLTGGRAAQGMTDELLDDYEEGTWTPRYGTSGVQPPFISYTTGTTGRYTKIGNMVTVSGAIVTNSVDATGATGNLLVIGLPYAPSGSTQFNTAAVNFVLNWAANSAPYSGYVIASGIQLFTRATSNGNAGQPTATALATGTNSNYLYFTCTYFTA